MSDEWKVVSRRHRRARFSPTITIRRNGQLAVSTDFVRMASIAECTRATLFLSDDGMKLAIQFHNDERDDDAYLLGHDGGGRGKGRLIAGNTLIAQSDILRSLLNEDSRARRCEPQRDGIRWVMALAPCFEKRVNLAIDLPKDATGIYRYIRGQEIIYIGRGALRERAASHEREHWDFDVVEYSIINDEVAEAKWETFWLNEFRRRNGKWPRHNKIAGLGVS